jgi:hypothetical protein
VRLRNYFDNVTFHADSLFLLKGDRQIPVSSVDSLRKAGIWRSLASKLGVAFECDIVKLPRPFTKIGTNSTRIHADETDSHGFFIFICVHPCDPC